jgi:SAM-dependent methyltransferase
MNPGTVMLHQMARARRFNRWMAQTISPFMCGDVLEIGAGIGNLTEFLLPSAKQYLALDTEEGHLRTIEQRLGAYPNLKTLLADAAKAPTLLELRSRFDTVVALNVLEHIPDDEAALRNIRDALRPKGTAVILVPQGKFAFGSLDQVLDHQRRYSKRELVEKMRRAGFHIERVIPFNRATFPGWILNSRILRRRTLSSTQLGLFNALVPLWRILDPLLPWPATSLIAIGRKEPPRE